MCARNQIQFSSAIVLTMADGSVFPENRVSCRGVSIVGTGQEPYVDSPDA